MFPGLKQFPRRQWLLASESAHSKFAVYLVRESTPSLLGLSVHAVGNDERLQREQHMCRAYSYQIQIQILHIQILQALQASLLHTFRSMIIVPAFRIMWGHQSVRPIKIRGFAN